MKAVRCGSNSSAVLEEDVPRPERGEGEALIKILRAGVCNTDLEIIKGYMGGFKGILGHEFVGRVEEIDDNDKNIAVGQKVVGEINLPCNDCDFCEMKGVHKRNHCLKRSTLGILDKDGTFSEYMTLPVQNLHALPDSITSKEAIFVEPLAAAFRIVEQMSFNETDHIAVVGDGKLGLLITEVLQLQPHAELRLFGKHVDKLKMVPEGVETHIVELGEKTKIKFADAFDVCIEASGSPNGLMMAAAITKPLGTVILKSTCAADSTGFNTSPFVIKELKIIGSRCGNFPMALEAIESKQIDVGKFVTQTYMFKDALRAIEHARHAGALKIQMIMDMELV